jgi:hypothetical protein
MSLIHRLHPSISFNLLNYDLQNYLLTKRVTGDAFRGVYGQLYPQVGLASPGARVKVNFGKSPFVFNGYDTRHVMAN